MGFNGHFAGQQSVRAHVRFGSKADIATDQLNVRFTPKSGHGSVGSHHATIADRRSRIPISRMKPGRPMLERLSALVAQNVGGGLFIDGTARREAALVGIFESKCRG